MLADINKGECISICYGAAIDNKVAEIDIITDQRYRKHGYGYEVAQKFMQNSINKNIKPSWDCFTNNDGSMRLAKKLGFTFQMKYNFHTITL